ncbi:hypothetical protein SAPIO_CDS1810 [Scedosporium apiospermum]|uniref:Uncharacterized protein n=1 Tax=Pseudallescheria apiosperma TaxID=563466 RepID=A0A084GDT0_PSEDA|nr:uncharacterized protein SAPIO_CDS1810 [Scedosporium apiospermum]KEZ45492.1 hypothetical protein SAPIO_CDS1810 [Scedosporium apiospermum]
MAETSATLNCSLNTTECILETLAAVLEELRAQRGEYDWDPLTFGVTAAIGILALIIAILTVGQGLLAAGPGRLKSSRNALGPWAKFSKRTFDWSEMRFRTVAYTPLLVAPPPLRFPSWFGLTVNINITKDTEEGYWYKKIKDEEEWAEMDSSGFLFGATDHFPATWLALLTSVGLDDVELWERKHTGADYIPAEFPAVPAYGSIGVAIALAASYSSDEVQLSRFWAMRQREWENLSPQFEDGFTPGVRYIAEKAMTWARRVVGGPTIPLDLFLPVHRVVLVCIADLYSAKSNLDRDDYYTLSRSMLEEIKKITKWLSSIRWPGDESWAEEIRCRQRTICGVGSGLGSVCKNWDEANTPKPEDTPEMEIVPSAVFVDSALHGVLRALNSYIVSKKADYSLFASTQGEKERLASLYKVHILWELDGSSPPKFKRPDDVQHPLDDLLIYRAVLIAVVYSSAQDTSSLINNNLFDMIVPIA